jgi:hypothetical protein
MGLFETAAGTAFPWLTAGLSLGSSVIGNMLGKRKPTAPRPEDFAKYKNQFVMSDADMAGMMGQTAGRAGQANLGNIAAIRQMTAGGNTPAGAQSDMMAGNAYNLGAGLAQQLPGLQMQQKQSEQDWARQMMNVQMNRSMDEADTQNENKQNWAMIPGELSKIALLWQHGYFDKDKGRGGIPPRPQNGYGGNS